MSDFTERCSSCGCVISYDYSPQRRAVRTVDEDGQPHSGCVPTLPPMSESQFRPGQPGVVRTPKLAPAPRDSGAPPPPAARESSHRSESDLLKGILA